MTYLLEIHKESNLGFMFGARTGPRLAPFYRIKIPAPGHCQKSCMDQAPVREARKPFEVGSQRFPERKRVSVNPGVGAYDHDVPRTRKVCYPQSFGRSPIFLPQIVSESTVPPNTFKLDTTKNEKQYLRKLAYLKLYFD